MVTFTHDSVGTSESLWQKWLPSHPMPQVDLAAAPSLVVVAAHPDDETLGAGGLIVEAGRRGIPVTVVVATAGEASHPRSTTVSPQALADRRAQEVTWPRGSRW
jgi:hypothetical protein